MSAVRISLVPAAFLLLAGLAACSKDAEALSFAEELDGVSNEIVRIVKSAPTPSAGVDAAQKYLDERKSGLRQKFDAFKDARGFQISSETKQRLETSLTSGITAVSGLQLEFMLLEVTDAGFKAKIDKLVKDYSTLIE
jgi:hypothetical protein